MAPETVFGDPFNSSQTTEKGSDGSFETFETGKPGDDGGTNDDDNLFTISDEMITSTTASTPAYAVTFSGGDGGDGGSSGCCDGGEGGKGGYFNTATVMGAASILTTMTQSPGVIISLLNGKGGRGGDSGLDDEGGKGGSAHSLTGSVLQLLTSTNQSATISTIWNIITQGDQSTAVEIINSGGHGGDGGTGFTDGADGGTGQTTAETVVGSSSSIFAPFFLNAQTSGSESPGLSVTATAGNGGKGGDNDIAKGGTGGGWWHATEYCGRCDRHA